MDGIHHVYLVPGFFGFANLGRITYSGHVQRLAALALTVSAVKVGRDIRLLAPLAPGS